MAFGVAAPASAATVTEFRLGPESISSLAQSPDGTIFYSASYPHGSPAQFEPSSGVVGRVGPDGPLGETPIPRPFPGEIAVGSEGDAWLASNLGPIARLTTGGEWSVSSMHPNGSDTFVATAAGGGVWFTARNDSGGDVVGRISAAGGVAEFPIPTHESGPREIVEGHEGDAWFTEIFAAKIGRVTPTGQVTEYPVPNVSRPESIAVDGEGELWFTGQGAGWVGKISPDGSRTAFPLPNGVTARAIAAGPDGRIWFIESAQHRYGPHHEFAVTDLGRLGIDGRYSEVRLPEAFEPVDLIAGSEGDLWFTAMDKGSALVARVGVEPLRTQIADGGATVWRNRVNVPITCREGDAGDNCRGTLEVKIAGRPVGRDRYVVPVDYTREWPAKRLRGIPSLLTPGVGRRRAVAIIRPDTGGRVRRTITLSPSD